MSQGELYRVIQRVEKELMAQKDGVFREQVADVAPHIFTVDAKEVKAQVTQQLLLKYGGARGSSTKLPKTIQDVVDKEVPKFTAKMYELFDPARNRRYYKFSERTGTPQKFTVTIIIKPGVARTGTKLSVFAAIRRVKQRAQRPLIRALNKALSKIGRDQKIDASSFIDLGHEKGLALERAELALDTIGEAIEDIPASKQTKEFTRIVNNLRKVGVRIGIDSRWPRGDKEFTVSIFLESASLNRAKGAADEKRILDALQEELRKVLESYPGWATQKSSDDKVLEVQKEVIKSLNSIKNNKYVQTSFDPKLIKAVDRSSSKAKGRKRSPRVAGVQVKETILDLSEVAPEKRQESSQNLLSLKALLNARIQDTVVKNMQAPALVNRTGRFAGSVRITDIVMTKRGFPSIGYTYDKNPYQVFEQGAGRTPWANADRDPRSLIDRSIREIAREQIMGRFYTRRV